jgi:hypothetical protein
MIFFSGCEKSTLGLLLKSNRLRNVFFILLQSSLVVALPTTGGRHPPRGYNGDDRSLSRSLVLAGRDTTCLVTRQPFTSSTDGELGCFFLAAPPPLSVFGATEKGCSCAASCGLEDAG